mgnify:CR=1 FL=1|tara:strand:+ start:36 stop:446 length:411 start_codon:yes stop_codon:yes gene_type:complete
MTEHQPYEEKLNRPPDFVVDYRFLTEKEGGRMSGPPLQGYRSDFWYEHENQKPNQIFMIWPEFLDDQGKVITTKESRVPSSGKAQMWIVNQEMTKYHQGRIYIGLEGFFMEGGTRVAQCQVTEIVGLKEPDNIKKK